MDDRARVKALPQSSSSVLVAGPIRQLHPSHSAVSTANTQAIAPQGSQGNVGASTRAQIRKEAPPQESEKDFMDRVLALARPQGWKVYHTYDSRRSDPGFPDLVLCRDGRLLFWELKSIKGRMKPVQLEWINALIGCSGVEVGIYRPQDWDLIVGQLGG